MTRSAAPDLVEPAFSWVPDYHKTFGPEVGEVASLAGFGPDPEQALVLDAMFAFDRYGKRVAFEVAAIACRQNMKTGLFKQHALGCLFILEHRLCVWSAHEFGTAQEAFRDMCQLIEGTPDLDREVKQIHRGNGDEAIELKGDRRLKFKARTKGGGRGLTGNNVTLDEAFALQPMHMGALLPTLSAVEDPQVVYGSSAGLETSETLRGVRDRGRRGGARSLAYFEWCDDLPGECATDGCDHDISREGCILDDEARWLRANPAVGRRITIDHIRSERDALPPEEFWRERLGKWDDPGDFAEVFGPGRWAACAVDGSEIVSELALALAVSFDRKHYTIAAAGLNADQQVHVEVTGESGTVRTYRPKAVVAECKRLQDVHGGTLVIDGKGPASSLIPALEDAGVKLTILDTSDVCDAYSVQFDRVQAREIAHLRDPELNAAVAGAKPRPIGDRNTWGRKQSSIDISPIEAVTLAASRVEKPQPKPLIPGFAYV